MSKEVFEKEYDEYEEKLKNMRWEELKQEYVENNPCLTIQEIEELSVKPWISLIADLLDVKAVELYERSLE